MTVRELLAAIRKEVLAGDLTPTRTGELASQLSALLANISQESREAEMAFNAIYAKCLDEEGKANRAEVRAKLTDDYARMREADDTYKVTVEMVRSLRKQQDTMRDEMRLGGR